MNEQKEIQTLCFIFRECWIQLSVCCYLDVYLMLLLSQTTTSFHEVLIKCMKWIMINK